jgi:hypothetical protein
MLPWIAAVLLGALAPALIVSGLWGDLRILPLAFAVTLGHAIILGLPVALYYRAKRWTRLSAAIVGAFLIGAIPVGFLAWPPTWAAWLGHLRSMAEFGALGAVGGFVFWATLKSCGLLTPSDRDAAQSTSGQWRIGATLAGLAVAASIAVAAIPSIMMDRSCHNMFRDGRRSVAPKLSLDLDIAMDDWPRLTKLLQEFAASHGMSFRNESQSEPPVKVLSLSECTASGVLISADEQRWAHQNFAPSVPGRGISVTVYNPNDDSGWLTLARELVARLEADWTDKVRYRGSDGRIVPKPAELAAPAAASPARQ